MPSEAASVRITGGDERPGVDVRVVLAQASNVQGIVTTALEPGVAVQVSLINDDPMMDGVSQNSTRADQHGKFTFRAVAPGRYIQIWSKVGRRPIAKVETPISTRVNISTFCRPIRSPKWPRMIAPIGRAT